jgi:putative RNA 2'-phosphotransferase
MTDDLSDQRQISNRYVRISKYLSKHLRHQPERLGLELLLGGWVDIDTLLIAAARDGFELSRSDLFAVVKTSDKQRFGIDDSGKLIRANQGHSTVVDLQLSPQTPPAILYHGTYVTAIKIILMAGLKKMSRHHVHLTIDLTLAHQVGARRGQSAVLAIDTATMNRDGYEFYQTENHVWLVDNVPPKYLQLLESSFRDRGKF